MRRLAPLLLSSCLLLACSDDEAIPDAAGQGGSAAGSSGASGQTTAGQAGGSGGLAGQGGAGVSGASGQGGAAAQAGAGGAGAAGKGGAVGGSDGAGGDGGAGGEAGTGGDAGAGGSSAGNAGASGSGGSGPAGASGSAGSAGGGSVGDLEEDYCRPLGELLCGRGSECGCGALLPGGALDQAACVEAQAAKCLGAYGFLADAVQQGSAFVWKDRAAACIASLAASGSGCERLRPALEDAGCDPWFGGAEPLGEPCTFPVCAGGDGICMEGLCAPLPGEGGACQGPLCAAGLICLEGKCAAPGAAKSPCGDVSGCAAGLQCVAGECAAAATAGQPCADTSGCAPGLACVQGSCGPAAEPCTGTESCGQGELCAASRSCEELAQAGEACATSDDCAVGLRCDPDKAQCVTAAAQGQPCDDGVRCAAGLACSINDSTCQGIPQKGEPCAISSTGPFVCAGDLGCVESLCAPLPGEGAACTLDNRCSDADLDGDGVKGDLACDFTPEGSFCHRRRPSGEPCQNDVICQDGLFCDGTIGTCAPVRPAGSPCSAGNECGKTGTCQPSSASTFACAPLPGAGEYCLFDCGGGLHCRVNPAKATCLPGICSQL